MIRMTVIMKWKYDGIYFRTVKTKEQIQVQSGGTTEKEYWIINKYNTKRLQKLLRYIMKNSYPDVEGAAKRTDMSKGGVTETIKNLGRTGILCVDSVYGRYAVGIMSITEVGKRLLKELK